MIAGLFVRDICPPCTELAELSAGKPGLRRSGVWFIISISFFRHRFACWFGGGLDRSFQAKRHLKIKICRTALLNTEKTGGGIRYALDDFAVYSR